MPAGPLSSIPSTSFPPLPRAHASKNNAFDGVGVGNRDLASRSAGGYAATPSAQVREPETGYPLRRSVSLGSLASLTDVFQSNATAGCEDGFGTQDGPDSGGVQRADYLRQPSRRNPLDLGGNASRYQQQHSQDVFDLLTPATKQWDERANATAGMRSGDGTTRPDALFTTTETEASTMARETAAREVLKELGVSRSEVNALLTRHAATTGGTAVLNACRLLSMPKVKANRQAHAALEKKLERYLDADKGRYTGLYRAFGTDASKPLKQLKECIEATGRTVGPDQIKAQLLEDLTPTLVQALAAKNPEMSAEMLRKQLPDLINAQALSALRTRLDRADISGTLQDAEVLPQLVQAAERPQPPANKAADPVGDFAKAMETVLKALPDIHIENNARNIVNQDGWVFQGAKEPPVQPAVEPIVQPAVTVVPAVIEEQPKVEAAGAQVQDEGIDMTGDTSDPDEDDGVPTEAEQPAAPAQPEREFPPRTSSERTSTQYPDGFQEPYDNVLKDVLSSKFANRVRPVSIGGVDLRQTLVETGRPPTTAGENVLKDLLSNKFANRVRPVSIGGVDLRQTLVETGRPPTTAGEDEGVNSAANVAFTSRSQLRKTTLESPHVQSAPVVPNPAASDRTQEEEATAWSAQPNSGWLATHAFGRLKGPIPRGQRASDVPELQRRSDEQA